MKNLTLALLFCLFTGCASMGDKDGPVNTVCPVSGEMIGDDATTRMVGDAEVGFCCKKCVSRFDEMTMADQKAMVEKMMMEK